MQPNEGVQMDGFIMGLCFLSKESLHPVSCCDEIRFKRFGGEQPGIGSKRILVVS